MKKRHRLNRKQVVKEVLPGAVHSGRGAYLQIVFTARLLSAEHLRYAPAAIE
jgi:hypothetical protein